MSEWNNPALQHFLDQLGAAMVVGQVKVQRGEGGFFELRHVDDAAVPDAGLRTVSIMELRNLAQWTADGRFRPLHASPDLRRGWRCLPADAGELEAALEHFYPGFLADWLAAQTQPPPVTDYQAFTARQTGMYRLTARATPEQAAGIVRACCGPRFCLKRRLWTAGGLAPDSPQEKSIIPCLEPCAVLLEFARKRMRIHQEAAATVALATTEVRGLLAALEQAIAAPPAGLRVADFNAPHNPRHLEFLRRRLQEWLPAAPEPAAADEED